MNWFSTLCIKTKVSDNIITMEDQRDASSMLPCREDDKLKFKIQIKNLNKQYGSKDAIIDLSINIYSDEATALLGHNGAGKTTLMSIITGSIYGDNGR